MKHFTARIVFDRKNETAYDKTKLAPVSIEVRKIGSSKRKLIPTGVRLTKEQYSYQEGKGVTIKKHPNHMVLRHKIMNTLYAVEAFILSDTCETWDDVNLWNKNEDEILREQLGSFIDFFQEQMEKHATTKWVEQNWQSLLTRLLEFGKIHHFSDLTYANIEDFDFFLKKTISSQPTIYKRHQTLKRVINIAEKRGIVSPLDNPYNDFTYKKGKSAEPVSLEPKELEAIEKYTPKTDSLQRVKDMYLFQCYTGTSFIDMQGFSQEDVVEVGEYLMIKSARHKTDENYVTLFTDESKEIAERYDYNLPKMSNSNYNMYLKVLAEHVGINKNITSHTARHTFATHCLNKGLDIVIVSKALGHTNLKQTERYARLRPGTIAEQMSKILNK